MIIKCEKCGADLDVHNNNVQKVRCPRCQNMIELFDSKGYVPSIGEQIDPKILNYIKDEIEKMKWEIPELAKKNKIVDSSYPPGNRIKFEHKKCLICLDNALMSKKIHDSLVHHDYDIVVATNLAESSLLISNSRYNLIVIDENLNSDNEAGIKLLRILNFIPPERRRNTFSVLLSSTGKTRDSYTAFIQGANLIMNKNDIDKFVNIIVDELDNHHNMYQLILGILEQQE